MRHELYEKYAFYHSNIINDNLQVYFLLLFRGNVIYLGR